MVARSDSLLGDEFHILGPKYDIVKNPVLVVEKGIYFSDKIIYVLIARYYVSVISYSLIISYAISYFGNTIFAFLLSVQVQTLIGRVKNIQCTF